MGKTLFAIVAALILSASAPAAEPVQDMNPAENPASVSETAEVPRYIIHAGGEIDGELLTNSLEAMNHAYAAGQRYIEVDFLMSTDEKLVCTHDWPFGYPMSRDAFLETKVRGKYTSMDLDSLAAWMKAHPGSFVVTDIKDRKLAGPLKIANSYPELRDRFIIQIYHRSEYRTIAEMGFKNIIYTVYDEAWEVKANINTVLEFAAENKLYGITYPAEMDEYVPDYTKELLAAGVPLFVHTVDDPAEQAEFFARGISGIYTNKTSL